MTESSNAPTHAQITQRAYEIFIEKGSPEGHDLDHWLEAERQLRAANRSNGGLQTQTARQQNGSRGTSRARK